MKTHMYVDIDISEAERIDVREKYGSVEILIDNIRLNCDYTTVNELLDKLNAVKAEMRKSV